MPRRESPIQKPNINRFHKLLQDLSVDTAALYAELKIDPAVMVADNTSLSMHKYADLLELAAKKSDNRFLGIDLARASNNNDLGVLSYIVGNAPDMEKSLELLHRYVTLVDPGGSTGLIKEDTHCILTYKIRDILAPRCTQCTEMTIAQFVLMFQAALKDDSWLPTAIYFEHPAPEQKLLLDFPFKSELIFNHFFSGVRFSHDLLRYPNSNFDPQLLTLLESQVQKTAEHLLHSDSIVDRVRLLISSNLGRIEINSDTAANELGMSRSTLNRRLRDSGTTFNTLRENVVFQLAKESLSTTSISITELAQNLGYSDSSAFDRAFKRLTGERPLEYRKKQTKL